MLIAVIADLHANLEATRSIFRQIDKRKPDPLALDFPTVDDGVRGMEFIRAVVKSASMGAKWVKM